MLIFIYHFIIFFAVSNVALCNKNNLIVLLLKTVKFTFINFLFTLTLPNLMSPLVVKRGLSPTLAIMKSFHLAIRSTEKIELMGMEVCFWASLPALTAIKLKLKQKANLWLLRC